MKDHIESGEAHLFPGHDSLCESCGYSLRDLHRSGDCPECGRLIGLSDPARRTGLPWQQRRSVRNWVASCALMVVRPLYAFDRMRVGAVAPGSIPDPSGIRHARFFLAFMAALAGVVYWRLSVVITGQSAWLSSLLAPVVLIVLTYIEAMGITYFARKHDWRVPWPLAQRIVCYASVGWLPAMVLLPPLILLQDQAPFLPRWATWIPLRGELTDWLIIVIVGGIASLWFETLVWLGVRRLRFANS